MIHTYLVICGYATWAYAYMVFPIDKLSLSCCAPNQILTRGIWLQSDGVNIQENQAFNLMWGVDLFVNFFNHHKI